MPIYARPEIKGPGIQRIDFGVRKDWVHVPIM